MAMMQKEAQAGARHTSTKLASIPLHRGPTCRALSTLEHPKQAVRLLSLSSSPRSHLPAALERTQKEAVALQTLAQVKYLRSLF